MISGKYTLILIFLSSISGSIKAQDDAGKTLQTVYDKLNKVNDYLVKAHVKVDMPLIKILPVNVEIYFKRKDKFRVKSKGIAVVPRQGFDQITKLISDPSSFTAVQQGTEMIEGKQAAVINVIPLSDTSDMILGKLWVNTDQDVIIKSQLTTRSNGTIVMDYIYETQLQYGLPDKMIFSVDMKKFRIPKNIGSSQNADSKKDNGKSKEKIGKIIITLSDYQVNKGLSDDIFRQK